MRRSAPFVWLTGQRVDHAAGFATLRGAPLRREDEGVNRWVLARARFMAPPAPAPASASLDITVDGRYRLWLNGAPLGRGPSRASPHFQRFDTYAFAPGGSENVLAVLIHVPGVDLAWYETMKGGWQPVFGDGGLYADLCLGGASLSLNWRMIEATAWHRDTARKGWGQDFIEDFDAVALDPAWVEPGFDDKGWSIARQMVSLGNSEETARGFGQVEPFPALLPRGTPYPVEMSKLPARLLWVRPVEPASGLALEARLYTENLGEETPALLRNGAALLDDSDEAAIVHSADGRDTALMLAFDPYHAGYPFIEIDAEGGEVVEIAVAEAIPGEFGRGKLGDGLRHEGHLGVSHLFRYTARPGRQRFESFNWTAVRAMQVVVRNAPRGLAITRIGSVATHYPALEEGAFTCSDPLLDRLWEVGRHTVLQCMQDSWVDCPGREARQWVGDAVVQFDVAAVAFGPSVYPLQRQFLFHAAEGQRGDGLVRMFAPGDIGADALVIPDFSLLWIIAAEAYYQQTGDLEAVDQILAAIEQALAWFERHRGPNDLLVHLPHWHFIEWADLDRRGEAATVNALYVGALKAAAKLAGVASRPRLAQSWSAAGRLVAEQLNARHWNEVRGVYVDSVDPVTASQGRRVSQHANSLIILFGIAPHERHARILASITDEARLKITAAPPIVTDAQPFDEEADIVRSNTFYAHFVYAGIAAGGGYDWVLGDMRRKFGPMLEAGATTLWESFAPSASLCHGFSATPVFQLSRRSLGISPLEPGHRTFALAPEPGDIIWAKGKVPTRFGLIELEWAIEGRRMHLSLRQPEACTMILEERSDRRLVSREDGPSGSMLTFDLL